MYQGHLFAYVDQTDNMVICMINNTLSLIDHAYGIEYEFSGKILNIEYP